MFENFRLNGSNRVWCGTLDAKLKDPCNSISQLSQNTQHSSQQKTKSSELEVNFQNNVKNCKLLHDSTFFRIKYTQH